MLCILHLNMWSILSFFLPSFLFSCILASICSLGKPSAYCVAKVGLEPVAIHLPQSPKF